MMTIRCYREFSTEDLLMWKEKFEFEASNWERRVKEQTKKFNSLLRPINVYKRWLEYCEKEIAVIDKVLAERGML